MTIKDLIKDLSELNPNATVLFSNSLEMGRSFSGCAYLATHQLCDMDKDEFEEELDGSDIEDDDKEHLLGNVGENGVVVFCVSGEETFCE
jgi:hypothetical protein